jgi:murein L,D-transpeptidase YafK
MMQMRNVYTLSSVCLVLSLSVFADEASEAVLSEVPKPVKNEQGQVVSPENMLSDAEDDKDDNIGELKKPDPIAIQPPKGRVPAGLVQMGEGEYFSKYAFLLDKSTRTLTIWQNTKNGPKLVEAHPADMGRRSGDKKVLGDKKTPEGIYFFRTIHEAEMLNYDEYGSRAYTMDYPNLFDVRARKTGSGIWLHAVPDKKSLYRGSRGCIVVRDDVITPLGKYIEPSKTPILVEKQAKYISLKEYKQKKRELLDWLYAWKRSWEAKKLDDYMSFYSDEFKSLKMNKQQWRAYKQNLNTVYDFIRVDVAKPAVFTHNGRLIIRFLQGYASNVNSDFGEKVLYAEKNDEGQFEIVAEKWSELPQNLIALLGKEDGAGQSSAAKQF